MADPVTLSLAATGAGAAIGAGGTILGGFMKADAEEEAGALAKEGAEFQAKQFEQHAAESRAAAQRQMFEKQRLTRLGLATLQARAAAGGDSATSGDVLKLTGDIATRGEYEAMSDLYTGENRARGLLDMATAARYEGAAKEYGARKAASATRIGSVFSGVGTILSGVGAMGNQASRMGMFDKPAGGPGFTPDYSGEGPLQINRYGERWDRPPKLNKYNYY